MKIDLTDYFIGNKEIYHVAGKIKNNYTDIDLGEFKIVEPINYNGKIYKVEGSLIIDLDIFFIYQSKCARCLSTTEKTMEIKLDAKLEEVGKELEGDDLDLDVIYFQENTLDLDKYILMEIASSLPMRVLCHDNCKGICSKCGKNLNEGPCNCVEENIDPRFEKLKDLFID